MNSFTLLSLANAALSSFQVKKKQSSVCEMDKEKVEEEDIRQMEKMGRRRRRIKSEGEEKMKNAGVSISDTGHHNVEGMDIMSRSKSTSSMADCDDSTASFSSSYSPHQSLAAVGINSESTAPSGVAALLLDYGKKRNSSSPRMVPVPSTSGTKMIVSSSMPDLREFEEYKKKRDAIERAMKRLSHLLIDMEHGVVNLEAVWEMITASNASVLHMELAPKLQASLCNALTRIIALENSMLNRIEDMQSCVEQEYHIFMANTYEQQQSDRYDSSLIEKSSMQSWPLMWDFSKQNFRQGGEEIHMLLQVNDHIDRVCEAFDLLGSLQTLLTDSNDAMEEEGDSLDSIPLPLKITNKFQRLLDKYEGRVLELRSALHL